jgi:hypothetical protein
MRTATPSAGSPIPPGDETLDRARRARLLTLLADTGAVVPFADAGMFLMPLHWG